MEKKTAIGLTGEETKIIKEFLLSQYRQKELTAFLQFDVFKGYCDDVHPVGEDGYAILSAATFQLMSSDSSIRVLIRPGTSKENLIEGLKKLIHCIKNDVPCNDDLEIRFDASMYFSDILAQHKLTEMKGKLKGLGYSDSDIELLAKSVCPF